jgi:chemotaxis protein methyltransferase WspC
MTDVFFPSSDTAEELLRQWIGLDPHSIGEAAIRRAVRLRMLSLGLDDIGAFMRLAETDRTERDRLVEEVVVAESWFFRDPQVYDNLRRFADLRTATAGSPIRILSIPCAAGEEPYSIAMTLLDSGLTADRFRIDAVDISRVALARAHAARYSPNAFRNADGAYRDRWFTMENGQAVLDPAVRSCVNFSWGNVLEDSFASESLEAGRAPYDVVFCRNLLIYLTPAARKAVERSIDRLLKPDGVVVLGAAEPAILRERWIAEAPGATFTLRRITDNDPRPWNAPVSKASQQRSKAGVRLPDQPGSRSSTPSASPPVLHRLPPRPAPIPPAPKPLPNSAPMVEVTSSPLRRQIVLEQVNALANQRRFSEAIALCKTQQGLIGPAAELYFMEGIVHQSCGTLTLAEECFHKTLYLDASHEEALLALSLVADHRGESHLAEQFRRSARRVHERKETQ